MPVLPTRRKVIRLYNGIDLQRFQPQPAIARRHDRILAIGRLVEKKGFADLIDACRMLHGAGLQFDCHIVGEGPLRDALTGRIVEAGLQDTVLLRGAMPQELLRREMDSATMMVLPCIVTRSGDRDGLPTVLLEALACGLPCVSTSVTGVPEIIEHERNGLIAEPQDPADLARCIAHMFKNARDREQFAVAGRRKAEAEFDLVKNVATLKTLFERSIGELVHSIEETPHEHRLHFG